MRPRRFTVAAVLLALFALGHAHLLATVLLGLGSEPPPLVLGQLVCLGISTMAARAAALARPVAPTLVAVYGVSAAVLILLVGPSVPLPPEERGGLRVGAAVMLLFGLAGAGYLRRADRRP